MNRSRIRWVCGAVAAFLAVASSASPPMYKFNNRVHGNVVGGEYCSDAGRWCRSITVSENYDSKGTYESTEAIYQTSRQIEWEGGYDYRWRYVDCFVDKNSIAVYPDRITASVVLETESPECVNYGYHLSWSEDDGYFYEYVRFTGTWVIEGEWRDPLSYGSSVSNGNFRSYDGWSGVTSNGIDNCKSNWGELMTSGGFSQTGPGGNTFFYPFEGPDGTASSYYQVSACTNKQMEK